MPGSHPISALPDFEQAAADPQALDKATKCLYKKRRLVEITEETENLLIKTQVESVQLVII